MSVWQGPEKEVRKYVQQMKMDTVDKCMSMAEELDGKGRGAGRGQVDGQRYVDQSRSTEVLDLELGLRSSTQGQG